MATTRSFTTHACFPFIAGSRRMVIALAAGMISLNAAASIGFAKPPAPGGTQKQDAADGPATHHLPVSDSSAAVAPDNLESPPTSPASRERPPEFLNLRYNEDYSYLDEFPEARQHDPWLNLKNIDLGDRWRLDFGGEFRLRAENRTNPFFGLTDETSDTQQNYRWLLHANVRFGKLFRIFAEGIFAHVESQDGPFQPTQENHGDIQQLFIDVRPLGEETPFTLRLGRQELYYGHDRMIGAFEWISTRRRFDGVKVFYHTDNWDVDVFAVRPVRVERTAGDDWNDEYNFYGVYTTFRPFAGHGLDLYAFHSDRSDHVENPNGHIGGRSVTTAGTRIWGELDGWDYDIEAAGQWGQWAGDTVQATFIEADFGYKFDHPWYPRIGTGLGWASGDDDPFDRHVGTWDQLFTYDHVCISFQDLVGRQNLTRYYLSLEAWPTSKFKASVFYHLYWLNEETDYYYNAGASPVLRDPYGHGGKELGQALELQLEYHIDVHASIMAVYSHFWDGGFFHSVVGDDDDPDLFFLQFRYRF